MNVRTITLAAGVTLACLVTGTASAQEAEPDTWIALPNPASRTSVRAETLAAMAADRAAGRQQEQEASSDAWRQVALTKTRAQVRAELFASRRSGEFDRLHAEAPSFDVQPAPLRYARASR